jgi:hypothetical protein
VNWPLLFGAAGLAAWAGNVALAQKPVAPAPRATAAAKPAPMSAHPQAPAADLNAVVRRYCATCHSDKARSGGLSLATFDVARAAENAEVAERMIRKLQAGFMPPPAAPRPDA